jgi:leucyl aminopeptidase (aminopeptidase T)
MQSPHIFLSKERTMRRPRPRAAVVVTILFASLVGQARGQNPVPDTDAIARMMVANAGIEEGQKVLIGGQAGELRLLEDLAVQVRKVGAFPHIAIWSDRLTERMIADVPASFDGQTDAFELALMDIVDVSLLVTPDTDPDLLASAPPERLAARFAAFQPIDERMKERSVHFLELGNRLFPTAWRAVQAGLSQEALASVFWEGVEIDYDELERTGGAVDRRLRSGSEVHVTHPNGTDLRFRIDERPVFVNDGVISDADREEGGVALWAWIPAGEAYTTAVPGSATGTFVVPRTFYVDEIRNLKLEFRDGRLTSMTGEGPGLERYKAQYDAAGEGRDAFGLLDLGLNPRVTVPEGSRLVTFLPAGSVSLGYGNNTWAGGENDVNWGPLHSIQGATVTVDGNPLVQDGRLTP